MTNLEKRRTLIVYVLGNKVFDTNYFNYEVSKLTTSEKVKNQWIKKTGHFYTKKKLRIVIK